MGENEHLRLHSVWLEVAFAVAWVGALSIYSIHIKDECAVSGSSWAENRVRWGIGLDSSASLLYVAVIYTTVIAVILWAGLGIYLAIRLLRGLLVVLLVTVPSLFARMFLKGLPLPTVVEDMTTWLPLLLALWLSMPVGRPQHQRNV
jgi:hypothetical protein